MDLSEYKDKKEEPLPQRRIRIFRCFQMDRPMGENSLVPFFDAEDFVFCVTHCFIRITEGKAFFSKKMLRKKKRK